MNNIRAIEELNKRELEAGIPLSASWHVDWSDTAYIYIGGLPYELSEGDIITIFSQFGEPVHVNLIRDKDTGKSKGFAFLKYEDQRSTNLAVDNLGGTSILGRIIRVDHTRYKPKEGELGEGADLSPDARDSSGSEDGGRHNKRRKGKDRDDKKSPPPREMLKEEIELQTLIRDHDEDDPMKDYLIRQKKEEIELALREERKQRSSRHRHGSERADPGKGLSDTNLDHPKNDNAGLGLLKSQALLMERRRKTEGAELGTRARTERGGGKETEVGIGDTKAASTALGEIDVGMRINPGTMY